MVLSCEQLELLSLSIRKLKIHSIVWLVFIESVSFSVLALVMLLVSGGSWDLVHFLVWGSVTT